MYQGLCEPCRVVVVSETNGVLFENAQNNEGVSQSRALSRNRNPLSFTRRAVHPVNSTEYRSRARGSQRTQRTRVRKVFREAMVVALVNPLRRILGSSKLRRKGFRTFASLPELVEARRALSRKLPVSVRILNHRLEEGLTCARHDALSRSLARSLARPTE
jgi:hypothetical protein